MPLLEAATGGPSGEAGEARIVNHSSLARVPSEKHEKRCFGKNGGNLDGPFRQSRACALCGAAK
eukprot:2853182-Rhodomonas_salina.1